MPSKPGASPWLRDGGDAAEEVGLFGYGFCADGEGVEEI